MCRCLPVVVAAVAVLACADAPELPTVTVPLYSSALASSANANGGNVGTPLSAEEEVMPAGVVNNSNAVGNAVFQFNEDGTALSYKLIVANIDNAFMAHIHSAPAGTNGGIVVWLYPSTAVAPVLWAEVACRE